MRTPNACLQFFLIFVSVKFFDWIIESFVLMATVKVSMMANDFLPTERRDNAHRDSFIRRSNFLRVYIIYVESQTT